MNQFLEQLYSDTVGFISVNTKSESGEPDIERWFSWPSERKIAEKYISIRSDEDTYVSVSIFADRQRIVQDSNPQTHVVWADADVCEPEKFELPPSIIVQTSPAHEDSEACAPRDKSGVEHCNGHYHVFWVLDKAYPAKQIQEIARRVAYAHQDDGCDLGWTLTKILRAPGTSNTKWSPAYKLPEPVFTGEVYSPEDFYKIYGEPEKTEEGQYDLGDTPEPISPTELRFLEKYVEDAGVQGLYLYAVRSGQSWSERMWRLMQELFRFGCEPQEVFYLAWNAACNKYNPVNAGKLTQQGVPIPKRKDPQGVLWREVQKAWAAFISETPTVEQDLVAEEQVAQLELLSDEERKTIAENPTFIDRFTDWCAYRSPDHCREYSHALAWGVLSCAHGNKAFLDAQYGRMPLNLWINIAGDSTRSRKTTVKNLALRVVEGFETQSLETIVLGSDVTSEKLVSTLGERDKMTSLLHIDEIQGFYQELNSRQYRIGTKERFTSLYDGSVPVVLRATQGSGNTHKASTVFNMWGVGIYDSIIKVLTRDEFLSGFMYRTTWAISPKIPYTPGSSNYLNNSDEIRADDQRYWDLVNELVDRSSRYDKDNPLPMRVSMPALVRVNQFVDKLHRFVQSSEDTALDDGIDRLRDSVVKAAALLSYHDGLDEVGELEMLVAIEQGERWFKAFQKVFRDVSGSEFSRRCDELEKFISTGQGRQRTESAIYKRFSYRTTEFETIIGTLVKQGRIRHVPKQDKWEALG